MDCLDSHLRGYNVSDGYMGYNPETGEYELYSCEDDYRTQWEEVTDDEEE